MSKYYSTRKKKYMAEMNIVPFIDVMLVLLVIFMAARTVMDEGLDVDLPDAGNGEQLQSAEEVRRLYIDITNSGNYAVYLNGDDPVKMSESAAVDEAIQTFGRNPEVTVIVRADQEVSHGTVLSMVSQLQRNGLTKLSYAVNPLN